MLVIFGQGATAACSVLVRTLFFRQLGYPVCGSALTPFGLHNPPRTGTGDASLPERPVKSALRGQPDHLYPAYRSADDLAASRNRTGPSQSMKEQALNQEPRRHALKEKSHNPENADPDAVEADRGR